MAARAAGWSLKADFHDSYLYGLAQTLPGLGRRTTISEPNSRRIGRRCSLVSIDAEWGLAKRTSTWGVPSKFQPTVACVFAQRRVVSSVQGGNGMKEATKMATSEALAHMLAVTSMIVIASVLFYGR